MIYLLTGENSFEIDRELKRVIGAFEGSVETVDGSELSPEQMPSLLAGQTLFADRRMVVIKSLSENSRLWNVAEKWLKGADADTAVVLVEKKLDKRLGTYKWLKQHADVREFPAWTNRDTGKAEEWARNEAKKMGVALTHALARQLVARTGPEQWRIYHALEKLSLAKEVNNATIDDIVDAHPEQNVFGLLETALRHDMAKLAEQIGYLRQTEDAYMVFSLLSSQLLQLMALVSTDKPPSTVAKEIGAHPFVLSKLAPYARRLGKAQVGRIVKRAALADKQMKSTSTDPWILVEQLLLEIAN